MNFKKLCFVFLVFLVVNSCEEEVNDAKYNLQSCQSIDCYSVTNSVIKNEPNVVGTAETQLQELQKNFQASYESYGYNFEGVTELLGHPIWKYTETRDLGNDRYIGYRTPFFSPGSPIVTAILLTTFDKVENIYRLKYIAREDVDNYPYKDKILKSLDGKYVQLSKELVIGEFLNFDIKLFAAYYHDLAQLLPSDDREISLRSCNQEVWYVEDCTHTVVGGRETNVECSGHWRCCMNRLDIAGAMV